MKKKNVKKSKLEEIKDILNPNTSQKPLLLLAGFILILAILVKVTIPGARFFNEVTLTTLLSLPFIFNVYVNNSLAKISRVVVVVLSAIGMILISGMVGNGMFIYLPGYIMFFLMLSLITNGVTFLIAEYTVDREKLNECKKITDFNIKIKDIIDNTIRNIKGYSKSEFKSFMKEEEVIELGPVKEEEKPKTKKTTNRKKTNKTETNKAETK